MRRMRPLERASMMTLLATCAAANSAATENCSWTRSMVKMGRSSRPETALEGTKPSVGSRAILSRCHRPGCILCSWASSSSTECVVFWSCDVGGR